MGEKSTGGGQTTMLKREGTAGRKENGGGGGEKGESLKTSLRGERGKEGQRLGFHVIMGNSRRRKKQAK